MWHALRAELAYFRPWLLGGLGIAAGVGGMLIVIIWLVPGADDTPGFLPEMFLIIAGMVVSFIAQSYRWEERRNRLLMAGPLTPRQLAGVTVLLPACLVGLAALAALLKFGLFTLVTGDLQLANLGIIGAFTGEFLGYAQMVLCRRQRRPVANGAAGLPSSAGRCLSVRFWCWGHRCCSVIRSKDTWRC